MADHYETLGVSRGASQEVIRTAFRRLALVYHPDKNKNPDAAAKFREINAAYQVLGNPQRRAEYDKSLPSPIQSVNRRVRQGVCSRCKRNSNWVYLQNYNLWQCQTGWCGNFWGQAEDELLRGRSSSTRTSPRSNGQSTEELFRQVEEQLQRRERPRSQSFKWLPNLVILTGIAIISGFIVWELGWGGSLKDLLPIPGEEATPTPTAAATPTPTLVLMPTPTLTPTPTPTPISTSTPTPVALRTATPISTPVSTFTPSPTATLTPGEYVSLCKELIRDDIGEGVWPAYSLQADSYCTASYGVRSYQTAADDFLRLFRG